MQHRATKDTTRPKRLFWGCAMKTAHLLRLNRIGRPYLGFPKIGKPSTCGFYFEKFGMVEGDRLNVVDRPFSWRTNQAEVQNSPRLRKIVSEVAKSPAGMRLLAGQRRGAYWWRTEGLGHGASAAAALKALQLDELAGLGSLLDGVKQRERLNVVGGGSRRARPRGERPSQSA